MEYCPDCKFAAQLKLSPGGANTLTDNVHVNTDTVVLH